MVQCDCIERPVRRFFYHYGIFISRHPLPFIIIPIIVSLALSSGFMFMEKTTDVDYLYTIEDSKVKVMSDLMESFYPPESQHYVQVTAVSSNNVWTKNAIQDIINLDSRIRSVLTSDIKDISDIDTSDIGTSDSDKSDIGTSDIGTSDSDTSDIGTGDVDTSDIGYSDIATGNISSGDIGWLDVCMQQNQICVSQPLLDLIDRNATKADTTVLHYPMHYVSIGENLQPLQLFLPAFLGGVNLTLGSDAIMKSAKAMKLLYPINSSHSGAVTWERSARDMVLQRMASFKFINITVSSSTTLGDEIDKLPSRAISPFVVTFTVLCGFAVLSCLSLNCVISKPWLGLSGILSAALAVIAGFGLLLFFLPFIDMVTAVPFLALGIGLDDMFVMIASWRKTSSDLTIEQRMSKAFSDAAVSITITTLTDVLAIGIGAVTSFPSVRLFCIFTAVCVFLDYVYIITVFAGCMVYSGRREAAHKHACTGKTAIAKSEAEDQSCCFRTCCTGGKSAQHPSSKQDRPEHAAMMFFRDTYGTFIMAKPTKIAIGILYAIYIGGAVWGCLNIREGLELTRIVADDSYATKDFSNLDEYFRTYDAPVKIVIYTELDYSLVDDQHRVEELVTSFEVDPFFHGREVTHSWLREFKTYTAERGIMYDKLNITEALRDWFNSEPRYKKFESDIVLDSGNSKIVATRYIVYPKNQTSPRIKMNMEAAAMELIDRSSLNATVSNPMFLFYEAWHLVLPNALQAFGIATFAVLAVCLLLIPNPLCSVYVALSIVSMCAGLVGYMTLWGVYVDAVSMVNIIMAVGFSVDFTAHIVYAFTIATGIDRQERVRKALYGLGVPIVQGSLSTILGVLVLSVSFVYVLRVFFVTIFLTMAFGALHGVVFIPVLLSLVGPSRPEKRPRSAAGSDLSRTSASSSIRPVAVIKPLSIRQPAEKKNMKTQTDAFEEVTVHDWIQKYGEMSSSGKKEEVPSLFNMNSTMYIPQKEGQAEMAVKIRHPFASVKRIKSPLFSTKVDISYDDGDIVSRISSVNNN